MAMSLKKFFQKASYWLPRYFSRAIQQSLSNGLAWSYGQASPVLKNATAAPLRQLQKLYNLFQDTGKGQIYLLKGRESNSGLPITVALTGLWGFGQRNSVLSSQRLVFGGGEVECVDLGSFPMWKVRQQTEVVASQADLVMVNANPLLMWAPTSGDWAQGPEALRMVFEYPPGESWEQVEQRFKGHKENLRRMRKKNYTYRISRNEEDFTTYYYHYYLPMVQNRHKNYGDIDNESGLREVFRREGFILFVEDEQGQAVSAALNSINRNVYFGLLAGIRDGNAELWKRGALTAVYYFSLHHGWKMGCRRIDAGVCLPFSSDGVFQHKRLWGYEPILDDWHPISLLLWAPHSAAPALAWMAAHPFLPQYARQGGPYTPTIHIS